MLQNIQQVQQIPISQLKLTHLMGLVTFTKDQYLAFFTQSNPAPSKIATQWNRFQNTYNVLNAAYQTDKYSLDTERLKNADDDCDHTFMAIKKISQAHQAFDFNTEVKDSADRMVQAIDKYDIDVSEDYLGENNKLQQLLEDINTSATLTADAETLGLTSALAQLAEKVALVRSLLTQRGLAKPITGQMKAARAAIEPEYRWLIAIINAAALMNDNEHFFDALINALNQNIDYLKTVVLARQGGGSSSSGTIPVIDPENPGGDDNNGGDNGGGDNGGGSDNPGGGDEPGGGETPVSVTAPNITGDTPFTDTSSVVITAEQGAEIRYTTDGSTPTASSTLYSSSITLTDTATVKAIAIKNGTSSEVATKAFVKSSGNGGGFEG